MPNFTAPAFCSFAILAISAPSLAQTNQEEASWRQDVIIVTGSSSDYAASTAGVTRSPTALMDVPQSIQVLTPTLLREQELQTLSAAASNISGFVAQDPAETVLANPIVRGFEAEIFIDGLMAYGDTAVIDPSSLVGVDRIEVAKGPTSTLFGGGTGAPVGGLVNLVTKTPQAETFAEFGIRAGTDALIAPWTDLNIAINEYIGVRLAAEISNSESYIDEVEVERLTLHPSLSVQISQNTELVIRGQYSRIEQTELVIRGQYSRIEQLEYSGIPTEVARLSNVDVFQFTSAVDAPDTVIENAMLTAELSHAFSSNLTGTLRARYYESGFDEFASFPFLGFFPLNGTQVPIIRGQLPTDIEEATLDASLQWQGKALGLEHTLLLGATFDSVDYMVGSGFDFSPIGILDYTIGSNSLSFGSIPTITGEQFNTYNTAAAYLQNETVIGENLSVLLSARYAEYQLEEIVSGPITLSDETYSEFNPRLGLSYRIHDGLSLYAGYANGSRLSLFFSGDQGQAPVPETSESYELGIKFDIEGAGLSGTLAVFDITRENIPVPSPRNPFASVQGGEQTSEGLELDLIWEPSPNLSVLANLALTDAVTSKDSALPGASEVGNRLARVPEHSGRIAGRYRFSSGQFSGLGLGLGVSFASEAPTTNQNTGFGDDYVTIDAQASYEWDQYRLGLNLINLTDAEYLSPYQYLSQDVVRPARPASAYISFSGRF